MSASTDGHNAGDGLVEQPSSAERHEASSFWAAAWSQKNLGFPLFVFILGGGLTYLLTQRFFMVGYVLFACLAGYIYNLICDEDLFSSGHSGERKASPRRR